TFPKLRPCATPASWPSPTMENPSPLPNLHVRLWTTAAASICPSSSTPKTFLLPPALSCAKALHPRDWGFRECLPPRNPFALPATFRSRSLPERVCTSLICPQKRRSNKSALPKNKDCASLAKSHH